MRVSDAITAGWRVLADRPADILPLYLLALGVLPVARVPLLVGVAAAIALLHTQGRIRPVVRELENVDPAAIERGDPNAVRPEFTEVLLNLVTTEAVATVGGAVIAALVVFVLGRAVAAAVTHEGLYAAVDDRDPLIDGVSGAHRWRTFLGLAVLRLLVIAGPVVLFVTGAGLIAVGGAGGVIGGGLILLSLLGGLAGVLVAILLVFAGPAAVVDDAPAVAAIRKSAGFFRSHPTEAIGYLLVAGGLYVGALAIVGLLNVAGAGRLGGVLLPLVVLPLVDGTAVALYADQSLPRRTRRPLMRRVQRELQTGWGELTGFIREHPVTVVGAGGLFVVGTGAGWRITSPLGRQLDPPGSAADVFGTIPIGPFVNIAANNWLVAAGSAYGGVAVGVAPAVSMLFNGALVGALAGLFDRTVFLALVLPHGVIEIPALAAAGGLGLHLGRVGLRAGLGRATPAEVGGELQRAMRVLIGIAIVLVVAAFIEAFITPRIAAFVL